MHTDFGGLTIVIGLQSYSNGKYGGSILQKRVQEEPAKLIAGNSTIARHSQ